MSNLPFTSLIGSASTENGFVFLKDLDAVQQAQQAWWESAGRGSAQDSPSELRFSLRIPTGGIALLPPRVLADPEDLMAFVDNWATERFGACELAVRFRLGDDRILFLVIEAAVPEQDIDLVLDAEDELLEAVDDRFGEGELPDALVVRLTRLPK
jgi:hypothetical protein